MEEEGFFHDRRNIKRRKYLKYNNYCGYSRKGSPGCSHCHPKRNDNTGLLDFTVYNRLYKNTKRNVFINLYMVNKDSNNDLVGMKVRLLTSSYY